MNVTQPVAGRSRDVDATQALFSVSTDSSTSSTSPYGWKLSYLNRVWSSDGPKGHTAKSVLTVLWRHADDKGRTWIGLQLLAAEAGIGNLRTVRNALERLVQTGWLRYAPQTWSSLAAEQQAAGRKIPRRGGVGQAPNLYELLDSQGRPVTSVSVETRNQRPVLVRPSTGSSAHPNATQGQICPGGPGQYCSGGTGAILPYDPDPVRNILNEVSANRADRAPRTHDFLKAQEDNGGSGWLESWQIIVHAHATKTKDAYGLPPMDPDVKYGDSRAMAECLDGAAVEVAAKLRARGTERELVDVRRELAERTIKLYFRNETAHLRRTKHALRDLPREFHARITEAMQLILRESHDNQPPRRPVVLEQIVEPSKVEKTAETPSLAVTENPTVYEEIKLSSQKLLKVLESSTPKVEPPSTSRIKPVLSESLVAKSGQECVSNQAQRPVFDGTLNQIHFGTNSRSTRNSIPDPLAAL